MNSLPELTADEMDGVAKATKEDILLFFEHLNYNKLGHEPSSISLMNEFFMTKERITNNALIVSQLYCVDEIVMEIKKDPSKKVVNELRFHPDIKQMLNPRKVPPSTIHVFYYKESDDISSFTLICHHTKKIVHLLPKDFRQEVCEYLDKAIAKELHSKRAVGYEKLELKAGIYYRNHEPLRPFFLSIVMTFLMSIFNGQRDTVELCKEFHHFFSCTKSSTHSERTGFRRSATCRQNHLSDLLDNRDVLDLHKSLKEYFIVTYPEYEFSMSSFDAKPHPFTKDSSESSEIFDSVFSSEDGNLQLSEILDPEFEFFQEPKLDLLNPTNISLYQFSLQNPEHKFDDYSEPISIPQEPQLKSETLETPPEQKLTKNLMKVICANDFRTAIKIGASNVSERERSGEKVTKSGREFLRKVIESHPQIVDFWVEREAEQGRSFLRKHDELMQLKTMLRKTKIKPPYIFQAKTFQDYMKRKKKLLKSHKKRLVRSKNEVKELAKSLNLTF